MNTRAMGSSSRLLGRLIIFVWAGLFLGAAGAKATPVKALVQDTLYRADGSAAQGDITIRWTGFSTSAGEAVAAGQMTVKTDANGGIAIPLIPNTGASPSGSYYRVVIKLDDGTTSEEMWVVPAVATTTVATIRAKIVPQAVAAQFASVDYLDTELAGVVHLAGTETIQGAKTFVPSPQVPAPTAAGGAANKGYVDQAMAGLATVASTGNYNDLLNKPAGANLASPGAIGVVAPGPINATAYTVNGAPLASADLSDGALLAKTSTTINGFPISSNVTLSASNLTMGALPNGTTATTQAANDNSTKLATTQYVTSSLAAPGAIGSTTPGLVNATNVNASGSVAAGTTCPASYPSGTLCAKMVNGMINAVGYGADPTGVSDSGAGILAAVVAATTTNPGLESNTIYFPCGDYSIHEVDLSSYGNLMLKGEDNDMCVRFFYNGAGGVGSYLLKTGPLTSGGLQYLRFFGTASTYASSITTLAQNALIIAQADSMTTLEHLSFVTFFGDAAVFTYGPTNLYMRHFRADAVGGYVIAIAANNTADGDPIHLYDFTVDNVPSSLLNSFVAANPYTTGAVSTVSIATAGSGMTNGTYLVPATGTSLALRLCADCGIGRGADSGNGAWRRLAVHYGSDL